MGSHSHPRKRVCHQVSAATSNVFLPKIPESWIPITGSSRERVIRGHSVHHRGETNKWGRRGQVTINILPDDVLLEIFDIDTATGPILRWHALVHVCRRWRSIVFVSTRRLNMKLRCSYKTPVRKMLDVWPALPIVIEEKPGRVSRVKGADNIVAALGHPDRVCSITLQIPNSVLSRFAAAMTEPFPELTHLDLSMVKINTVLVLPDSLLGGSAPRLQTLRLSGILFPAIPNLLSSASHLVDLRLGDIPHSGYISPEAMVTHLSALTRLEQLFIGFRSPRSRPGQPSAPRSIRNVLPALNSFVFRGVNEYLEDLTSRIDAPLLNNLHITLFNQLTFSIPRLCSFISRGEEPTSPSKAEMTFFSGCIKLNLRKPRISLELTILCRASDWQLSSLTQVCDSPLLSCFSLESLEIHELSYYRPHWQKDVEHAQWLELLHPFTTVKSLYLSEKFTPRVVPALQELSGERILDVLPGLQSIFLSESSLSRPVKESFAQFVTARQLSGHPVAVNPPRQV